MTSVVSVIHAWFVQKVNAEFSKHKLQTKAKLASFNQQLEQAQKAAVEAVEKVKYS